MTTQHECPRCDGSGVEPTDWAGSGNCIDCNGSGEYLNSTQHVADVKQSWQLTAAERDHYKQQRDELLAALNLMQDMLREGSPITKDKRHRMLDAVNAALAIPTEPVDCAAIAKVED